MKPRVIDIQEAVCVYYDIPLVYMREDVRETRTAHARQMAMYLARTLTGHSYPAIGRMFGGKDHSTVIHAVRQVERRLSEAKDIEALTQLIAQGPVHTIHKDEELPSNPSGV